jgi:hypothetical protein
LAAPADATFPGANGKIAFERFGDIWTMNSDGTNQVNLTSDSPPQGSPGWSADGTKLAFTQDGQIWKMAADGTGRTKLSDGTTGDFDPSWSPDDQKILFTSCCPPGHDFTLETMNADGTGRTVVGDSLDWLGDADWASDGSTAWVSEDTDFSCNYSVETSTFGRLNSSPNCDAPYSGNPSWSPDSQRVAYVLEDCSLCGHFSVYTIKRDKTDPQQVTMPPAGDGDAEPAWSPDGSKMAFVRSGRIKVINIDGTGIVDVTDGAAPTWQPIPINAYPRPKGASPMQVSLVPAYEPCTSANSTHGAPLAFPSCTPPDPASGHLTTGTPDANGRPVRMNAALTLKVTAGDVLISTRLNDVANTDLTDYAGSLRAQLPVRITDKFNTPHPGGPGAATTQPFLYGFTIPCATHPDPTTGSDCELATSMNALAPGTHADGRRAVWQRGQVRVFDGGADADGSTTADNTVFATQGVFVP